MHRCDRFTTRIAFAAAFISLMVLPGGPLAARSRTKTEAVRDARPADRIGVVGSTPVENVPVTNADIVHLLNRAAFGPTEAAVAEVRAIGTDAWIEQQLSPDDIADPELEKRLTVYPVLQQSTTELWTNYQPQQDGGDPARPPSRILRELSAARITRAVHAKAQLREVLADFWANHFSVFGADGGVRWTIAAYELDALRPHVLGKFRDLVLAVAQSSAMLEYLDNYLSVATGTRGPNSGINENYARELMELHTLGVDGGYTQGDVVEVARALTGWSITAPRRTGTIEFLYIPRWHDTGPKTVLGLPLSNGQIEEGLQAIDLLATAPATAHFISRELVKHLVADEPPESLVATAASVFESSGGDLRQVVGAILTSSEFRDPAIYNTKIKSPLELIASALRIMGAEIGSGFSAARAIDRLGQPIWGAHTPDGWPEAAADLVSAGGMVSRFDLLDRLARDRNEGITVDPNFWATRVRSNRATATDRLLRYILQRRAGRETRLGMRIAWQSDADPAFLGALALSCPEFQQQ